VAGIGLNPTMAILAGILLFGALISMAWAPETKYLTLTDAGKGEGETGPAQPAAKVMAVL